MVDFESMDRESLIKYCRELEKYNEDPGGYLAVGGFLSRIAELEAEVEQLKKKKFDDEDDIISNWPGNCNY